MTSGDTIRGRDQATSRRFWAQPRVLSGLRRAVLALLALWALLELLVPRPPLLDGISLSRTVRDRDGRLLRVTLSDDDALRLRTSPRDVSPELIEALLLHEDRAFRLHPGVNPWALARAAWQTVLGDQRLGASTLTMQVARLRLGLRTSTVRGKLSQILWALAIEWHYSKDEILEAYLTLVPMGGNVEGVGAASLVAFGKPAGRLNRSESIALAVVAPGPARRGPHVANRDVRKIAAARRALAAQWALEHSEARSDAALLVQPPETSRARRLPFLAPHFVQAVLAGQPDRTDLVTTLDLPTQRLVEDEVRSFVQRRAPDGIHNAAALLVDVRSMDVLASVGSADFFDASIDGQVDGTRARRSPGSVVKPFVYALAFEQGVVQPSTMLRDTPLGMADYEPENADGGFAGPISVHDALIRSRNVPALRVAAQLRSPTFYGFLQRLGVEGLRDESFYGLAPVLGGVEMTMQDAARGYAMLANGGRLRPLRMLRDDTQDRGTRVVSPEASALVLGILRDNPRPGDLLHPAWVRSRAGDVPIAWKSGTSNGFRDAWAASVVGGRVLVVWVGDFDGRGNPAFTGPGAAAPLLFAITDALSANGRHRAAPALVADVTRVRVCALSGALPGPHCHHQVQGWFAPGMSPIDTCPVHRGGGGQVWPSDVRAPSTGAGDVIARPGEPSRFSGAGRAPEITSPRLGFVYAVGAETAVPLAAVADGEARALFWFADQSFLGRARPGELLDWRASPGRYVVRVVDDRGQSAARAVVVAAAP